MVREPASARKENAEFLEGAQRCSDIEGERPSVELTPRGAPAQGPRGWPAARDDDGQHRRQRQRPPGHSEDPRIADVGLEHQAPQHAAGGQRDDPTERQPQPNRNQSFPDQQLQRASPVGSEGHPHPDLVGALPGGVGGHTRQADQGEEEGQPGKAPQERQGEP
jgi:hypothetical protein